MHRHEPVPATHPSRRMSPTLNPRSTTLPPGGTCDSSLAHTKHQSAVTSRRTSRGSTASTRRLSSAAGSVVPRLARDVAASAPTAAAATSPSDRSMSPPTSKTLSAKSGSPAFAAPTARPPRRRACLGGVLRERDVCERVGMARAARDADMATPPRARRALGGCGGGSDGGGNCQLGRKYVFQFWGRGALLLPRVRAARDHSCPRAPRYRAVSSGSSPSRTLTSAGHAFNAPAQGVEVEHEGLGCCSAAKCWARPSWACCCCGPG